MNYGYQDYTWGDLLTDVDGDHIEYDAIGNPVKIGHYDKSSDEWSDGYELTWNGRQLISYQYFEYYGEDDYYYGTTIEYTYNADGIRTSKTVDGIRHDYVLNGSQIISEIWKSGNTEHLLYYVYDENGLPIGLKYRTSAYEAGVFDCFFFEKNLQGDIIAVYNSTGKRIGTYTYDAWGNFNYSLASGNTALETRIVFRLNPFRYRGYYYDVETGLYYLQSRYYNPEWGRFLNADGYVSTGAGMLGYNMFVYANNNPVMFLDPTGEFPWLIIGIIAVATVVIPTVVNHIVNAVNYSKIDEEIKDGYTTEEAKDEIDGILSKYSGDSESSKCRIEFNESAAKITNSYKVTSRYDRQKISEIIRRTGLTNREYDNMSAEWLGHNICYTLHIKRQSTKDVDIDYDGDERFYVRAGAKALEILGWD